MITPSMLVLVMSRALLVVTLLAAAPRIYAQVEAMSAHRAAVDASNAFTLSVYEKMTAGDTNLVFCPVGLHRTLSLVREGAQGQTAAELDRGLHWMVPQDERSASLTALTRWLGASLQRGRVALRASNRLWLSDRGSLEPPFRDVAVQLYAVNAETLDFSNSTKAIAYMNSAIAGDTNGRVPALMGPGSVDAETTLLLANTVYFKGLWESPFERQKTSSRPFHALGKPQPVACSMMLQTAGFSGLENTELQALSMPFSGAPDLSMIFLLPVKRDGLREMERTLSVARIQRIMDAMDYLQVTVILPRFAFSVSGGYKGLLSGLGIERLFDREKAELEGISKAHPHLRDFIHETFIEVNELGGEAASAIAAPADPFGPAGSADPQAKPKRMLFNADHPFVFMVRHQPTGLILFMGRFAGP